MPKISKHQMRRLQMQWYMQNPHIHLRNEAQQRKMRRRLRQQLRGNGPQLVVEIMPDVHKLLLDIRKNFLRCVELCNHIVLSTLERETDNVQVKSHTKEIPERSKMKFMRSEMRQVAKECSASVAKVPAATVGIALKYGVSNKNDDLLPLEDKAECVPQYSPTISRDQSILILHGLSKAAEPTIKFIAHNARNVVVSSGSAPKKNVTRKRRIQNKLEKQDPEQQKKKMKQDRKQQKKKAKQEPERQKKKTKQDPEQQKKHRGRKPGCKNKPKGNLAKYVELFAQNVACNPGAATPAASSTSQELVTSTTLDQIDQPIYYLDYVPFLTEQVDSMPAFANLVNYIDSSNVNIESNTITKVTDSNNNKNSLPTFSSTFNPTHIRRLTTDQLSSVSLTIPNLECQSTVKMSDNTIIANLQQPTRSFNDPEQNSANIINVADLTPLDLSFKGNFEKSTMPGPFVTVPLTAGINESDHNFMQRILGNSNYSNLPEDLKIIKSDHFAAAINNPLLSTSYESVENVSHHIKNVEASEHNDTLGTETIVADIADKAEQKKHSSSAQYVELKENCAADKSPETGSHSANVSNVVNSSSHVGGERNSKKHYKNYLKSKPVCNDLNVKVDTKPIEHNGKHICLNNIDLIEGDSDSSVNLSTPMQKLTSLEGCSQDYESRFKYENFLKYNDDNYIDDNEQEFYQLSDIETCDSAEETVYCDFHEDVCDVASTNCNLSDQEYDLVRADSVEEKVVARAKIDAAFKTDKGSLQSVGSNLEIANSDLNLHNINQTIIDVELQDANCKYNSLIKDNMIAVNAAMEPTQNYDEDNKSLISSTVEKERILYNTLSILEIESQLENTLNFYDEFEDILSLSTSSISSLVDNCFDSVIATADEINTQPAFAAEATNMISASAAKITDITATDQIKEHQVILRKFKIPKITSRTQQESTVENVESSPIILTKDLTSAAGIANTFKVENIFGVTCLPYLVGRCFSLAACPFSHKLIEADVVKRELDILPIWHLNIAYRFMINHVQLFRYYFVTFCNVYTDRKQCHKLLNMVNDCERYQECEEYLQIIYTSLLKCGYIKTNACQHILYRSRAKSSFSINVLVNVIMDANWTSFSEYFEAFAAGGTYKFGIEVLQQMAPTMLQHMEVRLAKVFFDCLLALNPEEIGLVDKSSELTQCLELIKSSYKPT